MARKLTKAQRDALFAPSAHPQGWKSVNTATSSLGPDELTLTDVVLLRRFQSGETTAEVCQHLQRARSTVNGRIKTLLERFGVEDRAALLDLPVIKEQLKES